MFKRLMVMVTMVMVMFWCGSAMSYDQQGCSYFDQQLWGDNVTCLGYLELSDMGSFDTEGVWHWNEQFATMEKSDGGLPIDVAFHNTYLPSQADIVPTKGTTYFTSIKLDNRRFSDGRVDSRINFSGVTNSATIPNIVALEVKDPGDDCSRDNNWHFQLCPQDQLCTEPLDPEHPDYRCGFVYDGPWPKIIYQFMPKWNQNTYDDCINNGGAEPDCWNQAVSGNTFRSVGDPLKPSDVASIEWVEGNETITKCVSYKNETFYLMKYDTDKNFATHRDTYNDTPMMFFEAFSVQAQKGINSFNITLTNGEVLPWSVEIEYEVNLMPTVAATHTYAVTRTNKSGKVINTGQTVTAPNLTAREIVGDDGSTRLLIQWAEPDQAMRLGEYTRLLIFVGDYWTTIPSSLALTDVHFVFMDVPLHTGSVIVPEDAYNWVKDAVSNDGFSHLEIGGMYREQYSGYQNRGFFEGIQIPIQ